MEISVVHSNLSNMQEINNTDVRASEITKASKGNKPLSRRARGGVFTRRKLVGWLVDKGQPERLSSRSRDIPIPKLTKQHRSVKVVMGNHKFCHV